LSTAPTVFIVDDDAEVRDAIELLMQSVGLRTEVYGSARAYLEAFDPDRPGCVITDVRMPVMSGLELQEELARRPRHPPMIIITGHGSVPMAVRAVRAGAVDFVEKPFYDQALIDSVNRAISEDAERRGAQQLRADIEARYGELTPREREVLAMVAAGKRNKVIALELGISQSTVEAHRARVMEKMQAQTLSELMQQLFYLKAE